MEDFLKTAFSKLYKIEQEMTALYDRAADGDLACLERAARLQEELERQDFYAIDTHIEQVAAGLGLLAIGLDHPIGQMSGGQRAKTILAKLLLEKPDVLLMDEPTNFLDKEHVTWLAQYLTGLENAFMVVSTTLPFWKRSQTASATLTTTGSQSITEPFRDFPEKKTSCGRSMCGSMPRSSERSKRRRSSSAGTGPG